MHSWVGVYLEQQSDLHIATRRLFIMVVNTRSCEMGGHVRRITLIHRLCSTFGETSNDSKTIYLIRGETLTFSANDALCLLGMSWSQKVFT